MYLVKTVAEINTLSLGEWLQLIPFGDLSDLLTVIFSICTVVGLLVNNIKKLLSPYRAYVEDIDAVLGRETRKIIEKSFIPTRGQDVDPCNEEEIRENNGKYNTEYLIPFLCKKAFSESSFGKHYIILADSGMGKTTFLVNLYRYYVLKKVSLTKKKYIRYVPLSLDSCLEQIKEIKNKEKTILLLDALDENEDAMNNCDAFMNTLLMCTETFYKIVITCRTQFFMHEKNEPNSIGMIRAGVGDKNVKFVKKYITPFSDDEVKSYLRKRFRFQFIMQRKAKEIVDKVPDVMARPMILNWIDCLVGTKDEEPLVFMYEIYQRIIDKWIEREPHNLTKGKLLELSERIAIYMMTHATTRIPALLVEKMASEEGISLLPIVAKSRSLLNRNSNGEYKFAHRSFLEYFLSQYIFETGMIPANEKYLHSMSGFRRFFVERFEQKEDNIVFPSFDALMRVDREIASNLIHRDSRAIRHYSISNRKRGSINERIMTVRLLYSAIDPKLKSINICEIVYDVIFDKSGSRSWNQYGDSMRLYRTTIGYFTQCTGCKCEAKQYEYLDEEKMDKLLGRDNWYL